MLYANDELEFLGLDRSTLIRSLRNVEPASSFRTTFAYTNITHILAGRIVAEAEGAADWMAAKWVSLQLARGSTPDGRRIVSAENLRYTYTPKVAINDKMSYAFGWIVMETPNASLVWHNGGTPGFGAMIVLQPERGLGSTTRWSTTRRRRLPRPRPATPGT